MRRKEHNIHIVERPPQYRDELARTQILNRRKRFKFGNGSGVLQSDRNGEKCRNFIFGFPINTRAVWFAKFFWE